MKSQYKNLDVIIAFPPAPPKFESGHADVHGRVYRNTVPTDEPAPTSGYLATVQLPMTNGDNINNNDDDHFHNESNVCDELLSNTKNCYQKGLILPFWEPKDDLSRILIAIVYLLAFAYIFIGVSLLSGRVMMAVEVITSKLKCVRMIRDRHGKMKPIMRPFWSDVVKNLTLYVLGFSAPEILITLVEIAKHDFEKADLGPETIVGSRAYHLFIITAICIVSVPRNEAKRVRRLRVYMITSFWSIFAYLWIYLIISLSSRETIDIWEAILTFTFYPIVVVSAWLFEKYNIFKRKPKRQRRAKAVLSRRSTMIGRRTGQSPSRSSRRTSGTPRSLSNFNTSGVVHETSMNQLPQPNSALGVTIVTPSQSHQLLAHINSSKNDAQCSSLLAPGGVGAKGDAANAHLKNGSVGDLSLSLRSNHSTPSHHHFNISHHSQSDDDREDLGADYETTDDGDEETATTPEQEQKAARELLWLRLKALKDRFPGRSQIELETMAEMSYLRELPKNQSYYRIMTTRQLTGEGDVITREKIRSKLLVGIAAPEVKETKIVEKRRRLKAGEQRVFFCPSHYVVVECEPFVELKVMREGAIQRPIEVTYETVNGTASAGDDYVETKGKLLFKQNEVTNTIAVPIIDDEEYEDDEYFFVRLTSARYADTEEDTHSGSNGAVPGPANQPLRKTASSAARSAFRRASLGALREKPIEIGPQNEACVTILDDDHCGVFQFPGASLVVPDNLQFAEVKVVRNMGAHGRIVVPFELIPVNAVVDKDYREPSNYKITFEHRELEKTIKIEIIDRQRAGDDSIFSLKLLEPSLIDEAPPNRPEGLPRVGDQQLIKVIITESEEMKDTLDRLQTVGDLGNLFRTTWRSQFIDAISLQPTTFVQQEDGAVIGASRRPNCLEFLLHVLTLPWKLLFALLPPTGILDGWITFLSCIVCVGCISILIEDLASHFGCVCGIDKPITAITIVAIGTSLPDMFASRAAAVHEKTADAALAHISGSNAVNVYLGLGLAWTVASLHHRFVKGATEYRPTCFPQHLAANVLLFFIFSIAGLSVLLFRRYSSWAGRAELGGPLHMRLLTAGMLVVLYVFYIALTILVNEDILIINV